jgi:hypothetical protein
MKKVRTIKKLLNAYRVVLRYYKNDLRKTNRFFYLYVRCIKHTHASVQDLLHLYSCVEAIHREGIEGDIVECGSWRGGSSAIMLKRARQLGSNCSIYIYDSFEGLPEAREVEVDGKKAQKSRSQELAWVKADYEDVVDILRKLGIYDHRVHIVKGWFDQTTPQSPVQKVALLHSDGDLYESTRTVLENFYDKVAEHGFVVNNDYGDVWIGAKKAMDEFMARHCPWARIQPIPGGGAYFRKLSRAHADAGNKRPLPGFTQ